ncbi:efflux RND transporter periplasmic adaptor subunit [Pseudoxanthomonas sp. JBR18]|uniref:efflux RND transporter periplasmic adaptor subunit n=1 Tax=Pseudoxanthomonas sp. JBR18 TaxID=2969308 RepID=UPI00230656CB|nr:efflux RND transporter periplasmic adaptor subunit [Pseudoxanthomonas sp. JBR18]WCE02702.1 efflux RND transporter periplasmic adaptor subunit [Pseudoxanthomonas sp. JBR18]
MQNDSPFRIRDTAAQDIVVETGRGAHWKRWGLIGGAALVVLVALGWVVSGWMSGGRSFDASRVRIATVTRGDLVRDLAADGRVITANSPTLYAIAGGTVTLKVVAGDVVKQDQPLAVIDSPELRSKLAQEESTLAGMQAEASRATLDVSQARSDAGKLVDQGKIDRQAAARDVERYQRAFDAGALPQVDLAKAQDTLKKAEIELGHAQQDAALKQQAAQLEARNKQLLAQRQHAVVEELQRQVDALTMRAPFDGQVGQVQIAQGTNVAINAPILSVVDLSEFEVEIKVPESFARDLAIGVPAQLTTGSGQPYPGKISAVSPEVVSGEVTARVRFDGKQPPGLRQSQRMSARILLDTRKNVLKVERGPFVEQSGGRYAYVMDGSSAVRQPVQLGVSSLSETEVLSGLKEGDRVVVSGADQFGDAERVTIH